MQTKTLVKIAALGGILSVVLQMIGQMFIQVGGQEPAFNAELDEIVSFFMNRDPRMAVTGSFLSMLSFIPFIFFLGVLWKKLNATEEKFRWLSAITLGAGLLIVAVQITFYRMIAGICCQPVPDEVAEIRAVYVTIGVDVTGGRLRYHEIC